MPQLRPLALVVPVILGLGGCSPSVLFGPDSEARASSNGIILLVAVSRQALLPGDTAHILATVRNTNSYPVTLNFGGGCQVLYYVENAQGEIVAPDGGGWMCTTAASVLTIGPAESITRSFSWLPERTSLPNGHRATPQPLPPGGYRLYATLDSDLVRLRTATIPLDVR